jgi:hypothetical protein
VALYMQPVRVYKVSCLLLQVGVLCLYPSSGLLPSPIAGRPNMRTREVIPSSVAPECLVES